MPASYDHNTDLVWHDNQFPVQQLPTPIPGDIFVDVPANICDLIINITNDLALEERNDQSEHQTPKIVNLLQQFLVSAQGNTIQEHHFSRYLERVDHQQSLRRYLIEWQTEHSHHR